MDDLVIRGGVVLDGTGSDAERGDLAIRDGRIASVVASYSGTARRTIDARGLVVAPGFIDIKTHSDFTLPYAPGAESKVFQGVTTEVIGHCGFSVAPALPGRARLLQEYLAGFAPWIEVQDTSFARYMDSFPATAVNTIMQVGHNTLRLMTVGMDDRTPTEAERTTMGRLLEEGLGAGAIGLSSGLFTAPGSFARPDELTELLAVVRHHGGTYATHVRDEAARVFEAVREAIAAAETTGVHAQIVHLKLSGTDNWGRAGPLLEEIEAARVRGVRVDCDAYPYTFAANPLRNLLPLWAQEGGVRAMLGRLHEPDVRQRIAREVDERGLTSFGRIPSWDVVSISASRTRSRDAGRSLAELARTAGVAPIDLVCDLLAADEGATYVAVSSMDESDVRALLRSPAVLVGSDGRSVAPDSVAGQGKPHPRFYGTFPRVLGRYARDLGLLSLPEAVFKMTGGPARVLGLIDRGFLREGYRADITVFDPTTIIDRATYEEPHRYPAGISTTIVNGVVVVDGGRHTGARPGRVLRRGPAGVA
jgi:N-acyl-D-amino-acid deacylase